VVGVGTGSGGQVKLVLPKSVAVIPDTDGSGLFATINKLVEGGIMTLCREPQQPVKVNKNGVSAE
jgi:hypothetical protein